VDEGHKVFLDLKLFDIQQTIQDAVARLADLGVHIMTVQGDPQVVRAAVAGRKQAGREAHLALYGVTVLTSLEDADMDDMGFEGQTVAQVALNRAHRIFDAGADGVIASPHEVADFKKIMPTLKVITPGIRLAQGAVHDQKRVMTPQQAVAKGADHLVIGRQITGSPNPRQTTQLILDQLAHVAHG
jgi:orotidine-5'-phosphate decarboxylase